MKFPKPATTIDEQIDKLRSRGMIIDDLASARDFLNAVSYYRFSGYALHFEYFKDGERTHKFKPNTIFSNVVKLYNFDSALRTMLFSFIEHIEIAFRTALCDELSLKYKNPHWYLEKTLYNPLKFKYENFTEDCMAEFSRSREIFVQSYKQKYSDELPPSWMMAEILSIGKWSKVFGGLINRSDQDAVADRFHAPAWRLQSWMHGLSFLRNLCAHHCRIWNRNLPITPNLTKRQKISVVYHDRLAGACTIMADLLTPMRRKDALKNQLVDLLANNEEVPLIKLGFADNWPESPIWNAVS